MPDNSGIPTRKADHIRINLEENVRSGLTTGLEQLRFVQRALPDLDLEQVDQSQYLFGKKLNAPILISSMTGGTSEAAHINQVLASAAEAEGIAMGVGSQRAGIEHPEQAYTFQIRRFAPKTLLFANLGAVQLNYTYGLDQCQQAVDMLEADALILHLNALQEALQPDGDTRFAGLLQKIEQVCKKLPVPVVIKEVGWGISEEDARRLADAGVAAIDVAGAGGTSWSQVEMYRTKDPSQARVAAAFQAWGITTVESIEMVRRGAPGMAVFASGGLHDGLDIARCIALGAQLGGMAGPFLKAAVHSSDVVRQTIAEFKREIQVCMFSVGAANLDALRQTPLIRQDRRAA